MRYSRKKSKLKNSNNGKIKSRSITVKGIRFRSLFEGWCFKQFNELGWSFEYEKYTYELIPAFSIKNNIYRSDKVQNASYKPDFVHKDLKIIIECKGQANDAWPIRMKLFLRYMYDNDDIWDFYVVKNQKEFKKLMEHLISKYQTID